MVLIVVLGIVWLWVVGGMFLNDLDELELWIRRSFRKKLPDPRSPDEFPY